MLPRPQSPRSSNLRQLRRSLLFLKQPMFWGTAGVILLSGLFLMEYGQPRSATSSSAARTTERNNPLLYRGTSNNGASYSGGGLPDLPRSALPGEANTPLPIDPNLPLLPARSSEDKAQTQRSTRSNASRLSPFSPGSNSRTASSRSEDLYNPMGIPLPESWQTQSSRRPPGSQTLPDASQPLPDAAAGTASPLQSALDRLGGETVGNEGRQPGSMGNGGMNGEQPAAMQPLPQTAAPQTLPQVPSGETQAIPQPMPRTTGYTLPPAFRTTENTSPFGSSPIAAPTQPGTSESSSPSALPQPSSGQSPANRSSTETIGGGEINTFSNP